MSANRDAGRVQCLRHGPRWFHYCRGSAPSSWVHGISTVVSFHRRHFPTSRPRRYVALSWLRRCTMVLSTTLMLKLETEDSSQKVWGATLRTRPSVNVSRALAYDRQTYVSHSPKIANSDARVWRRYAAYILYALLRCMYRFVKWRCFSFVYNKLSYRRWLRDALCQLKNLINCCTTVQKLYFKGLQGT